MSVGRKLPLETSRSRIFVCNTGMAIICLSLTVLNVYRSHQSVFQVQGWTLKHSRLDAAQVHRGRGPDRRKEANEEDYVGPVLEQPPALL